mmetsp:Transcript_1431/g.2912  ORF Transcript_1431/g.2912 Transcript_1431/m.2912 type:complete len:89 (-) Transcript_1431:1409-1675(-)
MGGWGWRGGGGQGAQGASEEVNIRRLIYISCGFPAFKRDAALLTGEQDPAPPRPRSDRRLWRLVHTEGHVLFPGSDHVETLAIFDRVL